MIKLLNILLRVKGVPPLPSWKESDKQRGNTKTNKAVCITAHRKCNRRKESKSLKTICDVLQRFIRRKQTPLLQRYPLPAHLITYRDRLFRCMPRRVLFSNYLPGKLIRSNLLFLTNLSIINRIVLEKAGLKEIFKSNLLFVKYQK